METADAKNYSMKSMLLAAVAVTLIGCGRGPVGPTEIPLAVSTPAMVNGEYSYGPDPAQKLDLYLPAGDASAAPLVLVIHGGGWTKGDKAWMPASYMQALSSAGYVALNVNYRLTHYPEPVHDLEMVVAWARAKGLRGGYSVVGHSAGAHLAALLCASNSDCNALIGLGGAYDLTRDDIATPEYSAKFRDVLTNWIGCTPSACADTWREASPALLPSVPRQSLLVYGTADELIQSSQTVAMAKHVGGQLVAAQGVTHWEGAYTSGLLLQKQLAFLASANR